MKSEIAFLDCLAAQIRDQGYNERTAYYYAGLIGDVPISDGHGNVIVRDERGVELARFKQPQILIDHEN